MKIIIIIKLDERIVLLKLLDFSFDFFINYQYNGYLRINIFI